MAKKVAIPQTSKELAELLGDDTKRTAVFANADSLKEFLAAYNKANNTADEVARLVTEGVTNFLRDNGVARPDLTPSDYSVSKGAAYNSKAVGANISAMFEDGADFLKTIWHKSVNPDPRLADLRNYSSGAGETGGFLIPETLRSNIIGYSLESAVVRPRATVVPMDSLKVPWPATDHTTNSGSVFGGIVGYWTPEGGTIALSEAKFRRVVLEAAKLTAASVIPNELFQDAMSALNAFINTKFPEAIAFFEDIAFLSGNGVGQPLGVLNSPALISITKETDQVASTIVWENLVKLYARMLPQSLGRAVWVVNQTTFPQLATMALSVGTGGSAIWLNNGVSGPPATILGRPVVITEKVPALGAVGDVNFIDFSHYLIGDRQQMAAASSEHIKFQNDETMIRITERVDGRGDVESALTPVNGDTLSPFVNIAIRD